MITYKDIVRINKGFGGELRSDSSLDFAVNTEKKGMTKLAIIVRAILVDHPFTDGNKRTAMYVCLDYFNDMKLSIDADLLMYEILKIASKNITNIDKIKRRLKYAIW